MQAQHPPEMHALQVAVTYGGIMALGFVPHLGLLSPYGALGGGNPADGGGHAHAN
jgi:hypothetical protein